MSNNLIKKAYEHFNGVWPEGWESIIVSTMENSAWGEGKYQNWNGDRDYFIETMIQVASGGWQWVGTKADFDVYGESLKIPEGATHIMKREGQSDVYLKDLDRNDMLFSVWDIGRWVNKVQWLVGDDVEKINLANESAEEEWTPEVGQECEASWLELPDGGAGNWRGILYKGYHDGSHWFEYNFDNFIVGGEYCQFRPLKTESEKQADAMFDIVKDATDLYHACELLRDAGYSK